MKRLIWTVGRCLEVASVSQDLCVVISRFAATKLVCATGHFLEEPWIGHQSQLTRQQTVTLWENHEIQSVHWV